MNTLETIISFLSALFTWWNLLWSILVLLCLCRLWGGESCRRQQKRADLQEDGIYSGEEYQKSVNRFFD